MPRCGWQGDRDHGAWQRIAARGLTHQAKTTASRAGGVMAVRAHATPPRREPDPQHHPANTG